MEWAKRHKLLASVVAVASIIVALFVVFIFIPWILGDIKPYKVPSQGMSPTLEVGDRVIAKKSDIKVGDIVVFHPPAVVDSGSLGDFCAVRHPKRQACPKAATQQGKATFISRIVATSGDTVAVRRGQVILNGEPQQPVTVCRDTSVNQGECNLPLPLKIPSGYVFLMSDNRGNGLDSRIWGPIPKEWVLKKVVFRYAPFSKFGEIENPKEFGKPTSQ